MLTLSFEQAWFFDGPPLRKPWQRLRKAELPSRPPASTPPRPRGPRFGLSSFFARLPWKRPREVMVKRGSVMALESFNERAARPQATEEERVDALVLVLKAPGARAKNTEVVWDDEARRLAVGVWAGRPPGRRRRLPSPELAWYRSHWLPRCAGDQARVVVNHGTIEITVPRLDVGRTRLDKHPGEFIRSD